MSLSTITYKCLIIAIVHAAMFTFSGRAEARSCVQFLVSGAHKYVETNRPCIKKAKAHQRRPFHKAGKAHRHRVSRQHHRSSFGGDRLVSEAERYLGGNPTGWRRLWCGRFMAMVVRSVGGIVPRNPNLAMNWASLPRTHPHVGAIAVLSRRGGGHVGVVKGFDGRGNPIIVSGNHRHRVGVGVYPSSRVRAYVSAT